MKKILIIMMLCGIIRLGYSDNYTIDSLENKNDNVYKVNENFKILDINKQDRVFKIYTSTPTIRQLGSGEIALGYIGGNFKIFTNINDNIKYVELK